jgi:hypothetical protein
MGAQFIGNPAQAQQVQGPDDAQAVEEALQAIDRMEDPDDLVDAAIALGRLHATTGDPRILDTLTELSGSRDPDLQHAAQMALDAALDDEPAILQVPFSVSAVTVECNGECTDNTLNQLCSLVDPLNPNFTPIAVDCANVQDFGRGVACTGPGDNRCIASPLSPSHLLAEYCDDTDGWDATVYCAR